MYTVYAHINKENGKVYVGMTGTKPEDRWKNGRGYAKNTHFKNAIEKYGWDSFEHIILEEGLTREEACEREQYYIEYYNSMDTNYGYNMTSGGDYFTFGEDAIEKMREFQRGPGNGMRGKHHSEETRALLSKLHTGMKRSSESIRKTAEANRGRKHTEEFKQHLRDVKTGRPNHKIAGGNNVFARPVLCYETGEIFDCVEDATKKYGYIKGNLRRISKQHDGMHWFYLDEYREMSRKDLAEYFAWATKDNRAGDNYIDVGVYYRKDNDKYLACVFRDKKMIRIGNYSTAEEAIEARKKFLENEVEKQ